MVFLDNIRGDYNNAEIRQCSEMGCRLRLIGLNNYVILKGERVLRIKTITNLKICDCIIFINDNCLEIAIAELKSKTIDVNEVVKKLQNGSDIAEDIIDEYTTNYTNYELYPIILSKRMDTLTLAVKNPALKDGACHGGSNASLD